MVGRQLEWRLERSRGELAGQITTRRDVEDFNEYHTRELYFVQSLINKVYLPVIHIPALSLLSHSRTVVQ